MWKEIKQKWHIPYSFIIYFGWNYGFHGNLYKGAILQRILIKFSKYEPQNIFLFHVTKLQPVCVCVPVCVYVDLCCLRYHDWKKKHYSLSFIINDICINALKHWQDASITFSHNARLFMHIIISVMVDMGGVLMMKHILHHALVTHAFFAQVQSVF